MAESIFTKLAGPEIEGAATIFARKFKEAGVLGGGAGAGRGGISADDRTEKALNQKQVKAQKASLDALERYVKAQRAAVKGDKKALNEQRSSMKIIKQHQQEAGNLHKYVATQLEKGAMTQEKATKFQKALNRQYLRNEHGLKSLSENVTEAGKSLRGMATSMLETAFSFRTAKFLVVKAAYQGFNDFKAAMKYGTDVTEGVFSNMSNALSLGIDPARLSEIQASTRQAVNVMGGAEQWSKKVASVQSSMFGHVGDLDATTQFMADGMMTLVRAGIQPTTDAFVDASGSLGPLGKTFKDIQKISGATFEETGRMMKDLAEDSTIRWKLMGAASEKQRRTIIQETMERHKNLLAMGMNTEQAKRAAAALDQMAGKGPKERLKAAAKMQMMMGAMGIGGGAETAALMRKRVRTGPEDKKLAETMAKVNAKVSETQQQSLSGDFFATAMIQKTGMEGLIGPGSPFEKNLTAMSSTGAETALNTKTMAEEYPKTTAMVGNIQKIISNFAVNPLLTAILAGVSFIGATVFKMSLSMGVGSLGMGKGVMGKIKGVGKVLGKAFVGFSVLGGVLSTLSETTAETAKNANNLGDVFGGKLTDNIVSTFRNIGDIASFGFAEDFGSWIGKSIANIPGAKYDNSSMTPQFAGVQAKLDAANANKDNPQLKDIAALLTELKITNEQANKFSDKQIATLTKIAEDGEVTKDEMATANKMTRTKRGGRGRGSKSM
jgi:hypothetical protein